MTALVIDFDGPLDTTLTVRLLSASGATIGSPVAAIPRGAGAYRATFTDVAAGDYGFEALDGAYVIVTGHRSVVAGATFRPALGLSVGDAACMAAFAAEQSIYGIVVSYARGAAVISNVVAVPGRTAAELASSNQGPTVRHFIDDFHIDLRDLVIDGEQIEPQQGDVITRTDDSSAFEVMPIAGEPCWRLRRRGCPVARIHTVAL